LPFLEVEASDIDDEEGTSGCRYLLCFNPIKTEQDAAFQSATLEHDESRVPG
jgi:hypothetical protein